MDQISIRDVGKQVGNRITLAGWLYNRRSSGGIHFLLLRDGTGIIQCVVHQDGSDPETFALCGRIPQESSLAVTGIVRADPRAPGGYELVLGEGGLRVFQLAEDFPITPKGHGAAFLLDHRHAIPPGRAIRPPRPPPRPRASAGPRAR